MRIRVLLQVGAMHKPADNPDADLIRLCKDPQEVLTWAWDKFLPSFKVKKIHQMVDGSPFLIEFEAKQDINEIPTK